MNVRRVTSLLITTLVVWYVLFFLPDRLWWAVPLLIFAAGIALAMIQGHRLTLWGAAIAAAFAVLGGVAFWLL